MSGDMAGRSTARHTLPPRSRLVDLAARISRALAVRRGADKSAPLLERTVTSLDEYLDACREIFARLKQPGAVAFKDQSAYDRSIDLRQPHPRRGRSGLQLVHGRPAPQPVLPGRQPPAGRLPVPPVHAHGARPGPAGADPHRAHGRHPQRHRQDQRRWLTSLIELHRETRFDLFHANWPYSGELLFLGKNYPNVAIDFCWANMVDPIYCQSCSAGHLLRAARQDPRLRLRPPAEP